jgi:endonuclease/exonuclease/phosphatase family metal-dependent hydrolase
MLLLGAAAGCVRRIPDVAPPGPVDVAVITWNLHAGSGDVARLIDDLTSIRLTAQPVRDYVLLLQEAVEQEERGIRAIASARRLSVAFAPVRRSRDRVTGNAILSTFPLGATRVIDLPRERQPRGALIATIEVAGQPLVIVSTHLENRLGWLRGLFGDRARGRQATALLGQMPSGHGVLGGDMNTMLGPDEPAWKAFLERFPDTPAHPEPTFRDRLVLDHLFFDLPDGWIATRQVVAERYGSDHHPVLGLIMLRPQASGPTPQGWDRQEAFSRSQP